MSLFKPAQEQPAYLKLGIYGEPGSGKTYTATTFAIGLANYIAKHGKPKPAIFFIDTETGAQWVKNKAESAGLQFMSVSTRQFPHLKEAVAEAEKSGAILIADSMTHFWEDIRESYLAAKRDRTRNQEARLEIQDWGVIKPEWAKFTTLFLNSQAHVILCGRAGSVYEMQERDDGRKEMLAAGTRMAAEKGMGYEPSLLIEMTQRQVQPRGKGKVKTLVRMATVLKDRADVLDGLQFPDPTFENILPHIERLNLGGKHATVDVGDGGKDLFPSVGEARDPRAARRRVALGDIQDLLVLHIPGRAAADQQRKIQLLRKHFNAGWTEMEELMPLEQLQAGHRTLRTELEPNNTPATKETVAPIVDDSIPFLEPETVAKPAIADATVPEKPKETVAETVQETVTQPADTEPNDLDIIIRDFEAAIANETDANKRKEIWDDTAPARASMDPDRIKKMNLIYARVAMSKRGVPPRGKVRPVPAAAE